MDGLRDYQKELLKRTEDALQPAGARVMLQLPTGGGKTHIAGALLSRWLRNGCKAAWLTHRAELAEQTRRMLAATGLSVVNQQTWAARSEAPAILNGVVVLMAQTAGRRAIAGDIWRGYSNADLLVIDEAHHAAAEGWRRAIDQWPGRILGLTATPWRLSKAEGFDQMFGDLLSGPQVSQLQADNWLCRARVLMPQPDKTIRGGAIAGTGDYNESGIQQANQEHPDIMTAGALRFWEFHAAERQTVIYAISKDHARNLTALFNDKGIPAAVMLSDTPSEERASAIESFRNGTLRVLVNVAIATEGFDLPDASCVVITRPTMSLALYLQMVGRGLRPKPGGGHQDCLILDLAGNAEIHGLPEESRQWSLLPRGNDPVGEAPVVRCEQCDGVFPAGNHNCVHCGVSLGKDCSRCGAWWAWMRWGYENNCGDLHELVCDYCHLDAHIQGQLPVTDELAELNDFSSEIDIAEIDYERPASGGSFLRDLLEEERLRVDGGVQERKMELLALISTRELELSDDDQLNRVFEERIAAMRLWDRPRTAGPQKYRLFGEWEAGARQELADWKVELTNLEAHPVNDQLVVNNARERLLRMFEAEARHMGLVAREESPAWPARPSTGPTFGPTFTPVSSGSRDWMTIARLVAWSRENPVAGHSVWPECFRDPLGCEITITGWTNLLAETAEWLVRERLLIDAICPGVVGNMANRYLVHSMPYHRNGQLSKSFKKLSNGLYIELNWGPKDAARRSEQLLARFDQDPEQFHVRLNK